MILPSQFHINHFTNFFKKNKIVFISSFFFLQSSTLTVSSCHFSVLYLNHSTFLLHQAIAVPQVILSLLSSFLSVRSRNSSCGSYIFIQFLLQHLQLEFANIFPTCFKIECYHSFPTSTTFFSEADVVLTLTNDALHSSRVSPWKYQKITHWQSSWQARKQSLLQLGLQFSQRSQLL